MDKMLIVVVDKVFCRGKYFPTLQLQHKTHGDIYHYCINKKLYLDDLDGTKKAVTCVEVVIDDESMIDYFVFSQLERLNMYLIEGDNNLQYNVNPLAYKVIDIHYE